MKAWRQHHIGFYQSAALWVGLGHHGRVGDSRVFHQTVFHFARPDAVARCFEDIVGAALVPKVSVRIAHSQVTCPAPVAGELAQRGARVFPIAQKENRVWLAMLVKAVQSHISGYSVRALVAVFVDHRHTVTWVTFAHAPRFGGPTCVVAVGDRGVSCATRPFHRAIADDVVDFSLAKHLIDRHTQLLLAIRKYRVAHCFARTHHGLESEFELATRRGVRLHHRFQRSGE